MKPFLHAALASALLTAASSQTSTFDWTDGQPAESVLGQADFGSGAVGSTESRVSLAGSIAVDPVSGKVFASDLNNNRVLRYRSHEALSNGVTGSGGICVAAVLGQPHLATTSSGLSDSKFYLPRHITLDKGGRLWATDCINNRVVRFSPPSVYVEVQPDLSIGLKPNQIRASNRYNTTGRGQIVREKVNGRKRGTFAIRLQNDGHTTYSNRLRATRKNKLYTLRYRCTGGNLTGAITRSSA